jgi:Mce-associated membrane protein
VTAKQARRQRIRTVAVITASVVALAATVIAAYLKYQQTVNVDTARARSESVQAAKDATLALLSYTPQDAQAKLTGAADLLTGEFRDSYTALTRDVVIPGAQQKQISAVATVAGAASVSASPKSAVVVVFANQSVVMADGAPTQTASVVEVSLSKQDDRWLISGFDPK